MSPPQTEPFDPASMVKAGETAAKLKLPPFVLAQTADIKQKQSTTDGETVQAANNPVPVPGPKVAPVSIPLLPTSSTTSMVASHEPLKVAVTVKLALTETV
jgi:hypothetical protein